MKRVYQQWITSIFGAILLGLGVWLISIEVARATKDAAYNISFDWISIVFLIGGGFSFLRAKDDKIWEFLGKVGIKKNSN